MSDANIGLRSALTRASFKKISALAQQQPPLHRELLAAARGLPLLIRRHGLAATLALYWNEGCNGGQSQDISPAQRARRLVAESFIDVLAGQCPAGLPAAGNARAKIETLLQETLAAYLLHSRLALVLADVWFELAEPLLPVAKAAAPAAGAAAAGAPKTEILNAQEAS